MAGSASAYGGAVAVSWNASAATLTLSGSTSLATYQALLGQVAYQDTGTDSLSDSHPVRTVAWAVSDGAHNFTTSSQITINRRPVVNNVSVRAVVGTALTASAAGVLASDTDPDGDKLTVSAVSDAANGTGTLDQPLAGV
jgi:hypothetical protein